jgi:hypothetical protein
MHRKHKIVVLKEKRYELLKEVHDILGHKKIYAVRMQLLEQFWWPFLGQDVDNLNTTQTLECTKEKYNAKIKVKGSLLRSHQQPT